jgi:hypothetical protein
MSRHDPLLKIGWQAQDFLKELGIASLKAYPVVPTTYHR